MQTETLIPGLERQTEQFDASAELGKRLGEDIVRQRNLLQMKVERLILMTQK